MNAIINLLKQYELNRNEFYAVYQYKHDGWETWGSVVDTTDPGVVARAYDRLRSDPETFGILIMKESGSGLINIRILETLYKVSNRRRRRKTAEICA